MKLNMLPDSRLLARPLTFTNFPNRLLLSLRMVLALPKLSKIGLAPSTWFSSSCGVTTCTVLEDCSTRRHATSEGLTPVTAPGASIRTSRFANAADTAARYRSSTLHASVLPAPLSPFTMMDWLPAPLAIAPNADDATVNRCGRGFVPDRSWPSGPSGGPLGHACEHASGDMCVLN